MAQLYAEMYPMRSTFWRLLGEAGVSLAEAYGLADSQNQEAIGRLVREAMVRSLMQHHGWRPEDVDADANLQDMKGFR